MFSYQGQCVIAMVTTTKTKREEGQRKGGKEAILTSTKALLAQDGGGNLKLPRPSYKKL